MPRLKHYLISTEQSIAITKAWWLKICKLCDWETLATKVFADHSNAGYRLPKNKRGLLQIDYRKSIGVCHPTSKGRRNLRQYWDEIVRVKTDYDLK